MSAAGALPEGLRREELVAAVRTALDAAVPHRAAAVVAVSGGPDSVALAHLAAEARPDLVLTVGHVRHGLRDDAADARVAAGHAAALGLAARERAVTVRPGGEGVEAAARRARYAALGEVARSVGARVVLVGHTADDQAETVVLNLARGAGTRGVAGMAPERNEGRLRIVRPLLRVRRADVRAFVAGEGLQAVADPTNRDPQQRRARARAATLPALAALAALSGGPGDPVGALTRLADLARDDADALDLLAARQARRLLLAWGPVVAVRVVALERLPRALATRVVRLGLARVRGRAEGLPAAAVHAVLSLAPGQGLHVPGGVWVTAGGGWLAAVGPDVTPLPARTLRVPGAVALPELGAALRADLPGVDVDGQARLTLSDAVDAVDAAPPGPFARLPPCGLPADAPARRPWVAVPAEPGAALVVRARRPGDRLRLAAGRRTLADLLVDLGVPRAARELVPVVVDAAGEPLWLPGLALRAGIEAPGAGRAAGGAGPVRARLWLARG